MEADNPDPPNINANIPSQIGVCGNLILDAWSTTGLGGRDNGNTFIWYLSNMETDQFIYTDGKYVEILNGINILSSTATIYVRLTVTNWYGMISTTESYIDKVSDVSPIITLSGVNTYSSTNAVLNGKVDINSNIIIEDECDGIDYQLTEGIITWSVDINVSVSDSDVVIDNGKVQLLEQWLVQQENLGSLSLNVEQYLQVGMFYVFTMSFKCGENMGYDCNVATTHELEYVYSNIECSISSINNVINEFNPSNPTVIPLNGRLLTFDPDFPEMSKSHLGWLWSCSDMGSDNTTVMDCNQALSGLVVTDSNIYINLINHTLEYSSIYTFMINMEVHDTVHTFRDSCYDSMIITINTIDESVTNPVTNYIIQTAAISTY